MVPIACCSIQTWNVQFLLCNNILTHTHTNTLEMLLISHFFSSLCWCCLDPATEKKNYISCFFFQSIPPELCCESSVCLSFSLFRYSLCCFTVDTFRHPHSPSLWLEGFQAVERENVCGFCEYRIFCEKKSEFFEVDEEDFFLWKDKTRIIRSDWEINWNKD